jgi:acetyl esterase
MPTDTAILEPVTQRFVDALAAAGEPPVCTLSPADARATLTSAQSVPIGKPNASIEDATFPIGPKGSLRVRITCRSGRRMQADGSSPAAFFLRRGFAFAYFADSRH